MIPKTKQKFRRAVALLGGCAFQPEPGPIQIPPDASAEEITLAEPILCLGVSPPGGELKPEGGAAGIPANAPSFRVSPAETVFRLGMSLRGGTEEKPDGGPLVAGDAETVHEKNAERMLGFRMSLFCREQIPVRGQLPTLFDAVSFGETVGKRILRLGVSELRKLQKMFCGDTASPDGA